MTKCIVETTGEFGLVNNDYSAIHSHRPTVTRKTQLVEVKVADRQLRMLASTLPDQANDEDFLTVLNEVGDTKLAVSAYCSEFGIDNQGDEIAIEGSAITVAAQEAADAMAKEIAEAKAKEDADAKKAQEEADAKAAEEQAAKDAADTKAKADAEALAAEEAAKDAAEKQALKDKLKNQHNNKG